jgi:uncharacterized membrane protein
VGEQIANWITGLFGGDYGKIIAIFIISMLPVVELRGAILVAVLPVFGLNWHTAFVVSVIGNMLPIPFLLLFLDSVLNFMKKVKILKNIAASLEKRALSKKDGVAKLEFWGLAVFVGIPLPGTGGWTGALIATILKMDKKRAFASIAIGILIAGIAMTLLSYGVIGNILNLFN